MRFYMDQLENLVAQLFSSEKVSHHLTKPGLILPE
jgi:hypothetical protein